MVVATTGAQVVKTLQYVEESVFGTMPTSPTFKWLALEPQLDTNADPGTQDINAVGFEDVQAVLLGKELDLVKITFDPQDSTFLKYAVNSVNWGTPTGTIAASLSLLWSILLNGTENFMTALGCRINTLKLSVNAGEKLNADVEVWAKQVLPPTTVGPTTPTYATNPGTAPFNYSDEGATPVTFAATNLDITKIEVDFARNLKRIHTLQGQYAPFIPPTKRDITGSLTVVWENNTLMTDLQAVINGTLVWTLKSGTSVLTINNVSMKKLSSLQVAPDDAVYETYSFIGQTATLT